MSKDAQTAKGVWQPDRRVGSLPAANKMPKFVGPDDTIEKAITIMVINDFSQLPVLDLEGLPKGIIRWPTIMKGLLDSKPACKAGEWATEARTMHRDRSIYDAFEEVLRYEYVLITQDHTQVCGIVTAYDLGVFSHENLVPFMLVGEIELSLRKLLDQHQLDRGKQKRANGGRSPSKSDREPSLFELIGILGHEENWKKLGTRLTQADLLETIDKVRRERNRLMHFITSPDGGDGDGVADMLWLKLIARFLGQIGVDGPSCNRRNGEA